MPTTPAVLIVESDPATRYLLEAVARRNRFAATLAPDGRTALQQLETADFDVILLDLILPRIDGQEILRRLALTRPHLLHRIIVVTAASPAEYHDCEPIRSVWCVIRKPFDLRALQEQILKCSAERRRELETPAPPQQSSARNP